MSCTRREMLGYLLLSGVAALGPRRIWADDSFKPNYVLASALYGTFPLEQICAQAASLEMRSLDIWCKPHGDQREQIETLGLDKTLELLRKFNVQIRILTRYGLGPFGLKEEFKMAKQLGAKMIVTGSTGEAMESTGPEAKNAVAKFLEKLKPHLDLAAEQGCSIAVENHSKQLLFTPDSLNYFAELNQNSNLGLAFAPHHLHAWAGQIPKLIENLGNHLHFFYAQEYGKGAFEKVEKEEELKQLPGLGTLDYKPILAALRKISFRGPLEIFMHPTPRGVPILSTPQEVSAAVSKSRAYLDGL